jgi:hypothetical protein
MTQSQYNQVPPASGHPTVHGTFIPKNFTVTHFTLLHLKSYQSNAHHEHCTFCTRADRWTEVRTQFLTLSGTFTRRGRRLSASSFPSAWNSSSFVIFNVGDFYRHLVDQVQFLFSLTTLTGALHDSLRTFLVNVSPSFIGWRELQKLSYVKYIFEKIMSFADNTVGARNVKYGATQMRFACWVRTPIKTYNLICGHIGCSI